MLYCEMLCFEMNQAVSCKRNVTCIFFLVRIVTVLPRRPLFGLNWLKLLNCARAKEVTIDNIILCDHQPLFIIWNHSKPFEQFALNLSFGP